MVALSLQHPGLSTGPAGRYALSTTSTGHRLAGDRADISRGRSATADDDRGAEQAS
jgi:hypothetical protein